MKEEKKQNFKPFNLKEAKAGKPVCTRDGKKARIVCFDRRANTPIVALIECDNHAEILQCVHNDGRCVQFDISNNDLMMLPEKKEGWIIKPKDYQVYQSKEDAEEVCNKDYQVVAKIIWEE